MGDRIQAIVMPKLGLSMTEGVVSKWHVAVGAKVSPGDVIADIETSKITNELEVHSEGIIRGDLAEEGIDLPVGALLGVLATEDVSDEEVNAFIKSFSPAEEGSPEAFVTPGVPEGTIKENPLNTPVEITLPPSEVLIPDSLKGHGSNGNAYATHLAKKLAAQYEIDLTKVTGSGRRGRISKNDIRNAVVEAGGSLSAADPAISKKVSSNSDDSNVPATPLARKLALQEGINLHTITPTGSRGRVNRSDVEKALGGRATSSQVPTGAYEEKPLSAMRKVIAKRLTESKLSAPHFRLNIDCQIDRLQQLRADLNDGAESMKLSVNDFLIKAVAHALLEVPQVNIQFDGQNIRKFSDADVAVAVALEEGLVTPIIKAANQKSIAAISREMAELAAKAKRGALLPDEFEGGTFTLSNLGMFGINSFDAIINPPQVAILAVGGAEKRIVPTDDGQQVSTIMRATMSCDHRIIDGAIGARFMKVLKDLIEHPGKLLQ